MNVTDVASLRGGVPVSSIYCHVVFANHYGIYDRPAVWALIDMRMDLWLISHSPRLMVGRAVVPLVTVECAVRAVECLLPKAYAGVAAEAEPSAHPSVQVAVVRYYPGSGVVADFTESSGQPRFSDRAMGGRVSN